MEITKNDSIERMKKIREESKQNHDQALDTAKNSPYFIDRLQAPRVSTEAALPTDLHRDKFDAWEKEREMAPRAIEPKATTQKQEESPSVVHEQREHFEKRPTLSTEDSGVAKQAQKAPQKEQDLNYFGHKFTPEQKEIFDGLKNDPSKGKAMSNIEAMRMKFKQ